MLKIVDLGGGGERTVDLIGSVSSFSPLPLAAHWNVDIKVNTRAAILGP